MQFQTTAVEGLMLIAQHQFEDERGFFARTWAFDEFAAHGLDARMVQRNLSYN